MWVWFHSSNNRTLSGTRGVYTFLLRIFWLFSPKKRQIWSKNNYIFFNKSSVRYFCLFRLGAGDTLVHNIYARILWLAKVDSLFGANKYNVKRHF